MSITLMLYLKYLPRDILGKRKWTRPIPKGKLAIKPFIFEFEDRLTLYL